MASFKKILGAFLSVVFAFCYVWLVIKDAEAAYIMHGLMITLILGLFGIKQLSGVVDKLDLSRPKEEKDEET